MTVWKFQLQLTDIQFVDLPEGARILTVQAQNDVPCLWALCDPNMPSVQRKFVTAGTGHTLPTSGDGYIGSYQLHDGLFVGHVFEASA